MLDIDQLSDISNQAFCEQDPDDLAFMFATGKSEGFFRDVLAAYMNKHLHLKGSEHVTREWEDHDLAIMDGGKPLLIIEGKSWIYYDAYKKSKLLTATNSIFNHTAKDSKKMMLTKTKNPSTRTYISTLLFGVNTNNALEYRKFNVAYGNSHTQGIKAAGNFFDLTGVGRSHMTTLHSAFGLTRRFPITTSNYFGMNVVADFFLSEVVEIREYTVNSVMTELQG